ncbi:polyprotein [Cucumis melo var. makuwa]|uniref:Polyprotein n=1 Tax=Cucumis melo var. makuwa TaxID=1194695 RepID=A0A5D3BCI3_CUCMM|nr:polyprotein [Cucumis melo var. makuwa]TYJ96694.1 polyprotein [Cucumis melo var. makuwa]
MSAEQYAMDLQFQQVTRHRQSSTPRALIVQLGPETTLPVPSFKLLRPSRPKTPTKRATPPASARSPISKNASSFSQIVRPKTFQPRPSIQGYFAKTCIVDITIEPEFDGPSVQEICDQVFPRGFNFLLKEISKTRTFYEFILVDSKSAEITHVNDRNDPSKIIYSKLRIFRILTSSTWKQGMFVGKKFSQHFKPFAYNYRDYVKAWIFCWNFQIGPNGNFKTLSKALRIKWWEKFNYSHLEVNTMKGLVQGQHSSPRYDQEFNIVVNNVVVNLSDDEDETLAEASSPTSVNNNVVNSDEIADYDPYNGYDINDPYLDMQPY